MPIADISKVYSWVVGVCCLQGVEKERAKRQWDERMSENNSFWVEATPKSSAEEIDYAIFEKIRNQGISSLNGEQCVLALFLDLREPLTPEFQTVLWNTTARLQISLKCNFQLVMQFGYVGVLGSSKKAERANALSVVQCNASRPAATQHRLCLVASDVLACDGGNNWKAVMISLDVLRRCTVPTSLLPMTPDGSANNDIGFLRYGEYNKQLFDELNEEEARLDELLGAGGGDKLKKLFQKKKEEITSGIESRFTIKSTLQPQHPEMIVEPGFLGKNVAAAKKGKNKEFAIAQNETRGALILTGRRMYEEIVQMFEPSVTSARQMLDQMLSDATVGMKIREDKVFMQSVLNMNETKVSKPALPDFAYKEQGYVDDIGNYLTNMKAYAITVGLQSLTEALYRAYEEILAKGFREETERIEKEKETVSARLAKMGTAAAFCSNIAFHNNPQESNFNPISAPGAGAKFLLFRGSQMKETVLASTSHASLPVFEIRETGGGLKALDNAPLKALQIVFLDCSDQALEELMPEV